MCLTFTKLFDGSIEKNESAVKGWNMVITILKLTFDMSDMKPEGMKTASFE